MEQDAQARTGRCDAMAASLVAAVNDQGSHQDMIQKFGGEDAATYACGMYHTLL